MGNASRPTPRDTLFHDVLHLLVLNAFAVAQPLFELLSRSPDFLVARGARALDVGVLVLVLLASLPLIIALGELLLRRFSRRLAAFFHLVAIFGLFCLIVLPMLKKLGFASSRASLPIAAVVAAAATFAYGRFRPVRWIVTWMSLSLAVFTGAFLLDPAIRKIIRPEVQKPPELSLPPASPPIFMVVLDELSTSALMDENLEIDAVRYPAFAALAADSTWFRSATTVSEQTAHAVPALLSGLRPTPSIATVPSANDFPNNLFTLLGGGYELHVFETVTRLCPKTLDCEDVWTGTSRRLAELLADVAVVFGHLILPEGSAFRLPDISLARRVLSTRLARFRDFIDSIEPVDRPTLSFLHVLLPHAPYVCLPSGKSYGPVPQRGMTRGRWQDDEAAVLDAYRRFLLQVGCVDRLLGQMLAKLESAGLYDRSLVVVTADHGSSFRPGDFHRELTSTNYMDILPVPLLIKSPGQGRGVVNDENVELIDVLPSIAAILGVELPFPVDGRSVVGPQPEPREKKRIFRGTEGKIYEFDSSINRGWPSAQRKLAFFGSGKTRPGGLFALGSHAELLGTAVADLEVAPAPDLTISLDQKLLFGAVDLAADHVPAHVSGEVTGQRIRELAPLAIAVNGRLRASTLTYSDRGRIRYSAFLPTSALREGRNEVEVFALEEGPRLIRAERELSYVLHGDRLVSSLGEKLTPGPDTLSGYVDRVTSDDRVLRFHGWAANRNAMKPAAEILLFVDGAFVQARTPGLPRLDVAKAFGAWSEQSGFTLEVPARLFDDPRRPDYRVFAVSEGNFRELPRSPLAKVDQPAR